MAVDHEESIYRLIPLEQSAAEKAPMYRSLHNPTVPPSYSTFGTAGTSKKIGNPSGQDAEFDAGTSSHKARQAHASIGATASTTVNPKQFVKMTGRRELPPPAKFTRSEPIPRRAQVPIQSEKPVMGLTTDKNFIVSNAVDAILAQPKQQEKAFVNMTQTKTFGKTPAYLRKVKSELEKEKSARLQQTGDAADPLDSKLVLLTEQERKDLLASLKQRWDQLNKHYQALTFSMDTVSKVHRKEQHEATLEKLERAIQKLTNKRCVFVYDDLGSGFETLGVQGRDPRLAKDM